jgi:hypothetical protein
MFAWRARPCQKLIRISYIIQQTLYTLVKKSMRMCVCVGSGITKRKWCENVKDYDIVHHHLRQRKNDGKCFASVKMFCSFLLSSPTLPFGWKISNSYEFSSQTFYSPAGNFSLWRALKSDFSVVWCKMFDFRQERNDFEPNERIQFFGCHHNWVFTFLWFEVIC